MRSEGFTDPPDQTGPGHMGDVFTQQVEPVAPAVAAALASDLFGLDVRATPLGSERDQNFRLRDASGQDVLLKLSHPAEDRQVTNFQTMALLHIAARCPDLPVSRVLPAPDGRTELPVVLPGQPPRIARLMSFLPGEALQGHPRSPGQRRRLGALLARLGLALRDFAHPASGHELLWDMQHAGRVRDLLPQLSDPAVRALAGRFLDPRPLEGDAASGLRAPNLRAQVIHNDLNPHNVLVDPADPARITGILDFGDMVHAPLVQDVAVAAAYQMLEAAHPLQTAAEFVAGYHAVAPLRPEEFDLLFDLIGTRLAMAVTITGWRAARQPGNSAYVLRNAPAARAALERIGALSRKEAQAYFSLACDAG